MKKVLLFLMITGLTTMAAFCLKAETRPVSGFTGIDASGVFEITVTKGNTESLSIEADNEVMPYIRSEVQNGVLHLYIDKAVKNVRILKAFIVMKNLDYVALSGACKLTSNDLFTPEKFKSDCSGACGMNVNLNTGQLSIEANGASNIQMKAGVTGNVDLNVSGASKIQIDLKASNVKLNSGGICSVELTGSATGVKMNVSGTSTIKAGDFTVKTATIESSGTSTVTVNVIDVLKVNSSGVASVDYKGSPAIEINNSQAAKVRKI